MSTLFKIIILICIIIFAAVICVALVSVNLPQTPEEWLKADEEQMKEIAKMRERKNK